ncbi:MAG: PAS domain S-box protein, partial [Dehalococcoidia bacterium]|nr:PAS domain S-box protein [Dehalococcoidia bacterium]
HAALGQALLQSTSAGIYIVQDGKFVYLSPFFETLTGYSIKELLGQESLKLVHPDDREMVHKAAISMLKQRRKQNPFEYRFLKKNGDVMWVMETVSPIDYKGRRATLGSFMDIQQRKMLEEALAVSEQLHSAILSQMHDACFEVDLAGNFGFTNNSMCRGLHYKLNELEGKNFRIIIPEEDQETVYRTFNQVFKSGKTIAGFSHRVKRKDGILMMVESTLSPIRENGGKLRGFICVSRDVTESKRLEEALSHSQEMYRGILEQMLDSYYHVDLAGNFIFVNDSTCRNLGYEKGELDGKNFRIIMTEDDRKKVYDAFHQVFLTGEPNKGFAHMVIHKDGTTGYAESSVSLLRDEKGNPTGFTCVARDVTERRSLEQAIHKSEERYRTILEQMYDSYYEVDLAGNFTFVNDSVCANLLYSKEELLGKNYNFSVPPDEIKNMFLAFNRVFRTGQPNKAFQHKILRRDGKITYAESSIDLRRDESGQPIGFRSISRDITERKQLEEALLEEKNFTDSVLDSMPGIFYALDEKGNLIRWNKNEEKVTGYSSAELHNMNALNTIAEEEREMVASKVATVFSQGHASVETQVVAKDGTKMRYLLTGARVDIGNKPYLIGMGIDISERIQAEQDLKRSEERYRALFDSSLELVYILDFEGRFLDANRATMELIGYSKDEIYSLNVASLFDPEDLPGVMQMLNRAGVPGLYKEMMEFKLRRKDGNHVYIEAQSSLIRRDGKPYAIQGIARDITERKMFEQRLSEMATHDFLTGLPNRILLNDRFTMALAQAHRNKHRLAIIAVDLDRFKSVNDTLGHQAGDELLKAIAIRLKESVRSSDTVARMGGDEFLLLMPEMHMIEDANKIIDKIAFAFKEPFAIQGSRLNMSASMGLAIYPDDGEDMEALMRKSDAAMYNIKRHGPSEGRPRHKTEEGS